MTYSTLASQAELGKCFPPARSIPNLLNRTNTIQTTESNILARSSSQPAETWNRDMLANGCPSYSIESRESVTTATPIKSSTVSTQTDHHKFDLPAIEKFIVSNPRLVLNLLGIVEPVCHIEYEMQPQILIPIPEADVSSPESMTSVEKCDVSTSKSNPAVWESPQNSNNKNGEHFRSTDALLSNSSDDCLMRPSAQVERNMQHDVNFSLIHESSNRKSLNNGTACGMRSNSLNSISSSSSTANVDKRNFYDSTTTPTSTSMRQSHSNNVAVRKISPTERDSRASTSRNAMIDATIEHKFATSDEQIDYDAIGSDDVGEKCALLYNDVRKESTGRLSLLGIQKRNRSKAPTNYRFSAGDAEKLEKGTKSIPSSRSMQENSTGKMI